MCLGKKFDHRQLIVAPILFQLVCRWEFAAWNLQRHLIAAEPDIVVVLHSTGEWIPCCSICNAIWERRCARWVFARDTAWHLGMIISISCREMLEDVVVRCKWWRWGERLEHCTERTWKRERKERKEKLKLIFTAISVSVRHTGKAFDLYLRFKSWLAVAADAFEFGKLLDIDGKLISKLILKHRHTHKRTSKSFDKSLQIQMLILFMEAWKEVERKERDSRRMYTRKNECSFQYFILLCDEMIEKEYRSRISHYFYKYPINMRNQSRVEWHGISIDRKADELTRKSSKSLHKRANRRLTTTGAVIGDQISR